MLARFIEQPRQVALRRWLFQIHTYLGLLLGLYFVAVSVSGSALVFRPEIERDMVLGQRPLALSSSAKGPLQTAWDDLRRQYPGQAVQAFAMNQYPGARPGDPYRVRVQSPTRTTFVYVDSSTGQVLGAQHPAIVWLQDLHFNLFGGRTGLILNGAGAVLFALMCATGLVIWWPGRRTWRRGFSIRWTARWRGLSYDIHSAFGIVALPMLAVVAVAGLYLVSGMLEGPNLQQVKWQAGQSAFAIDLDEVVRRAETVVPDGRRVGLYLPAGPDAPFRFEKLVGDTPVRVYLDQRSGAILRVDRTVDSSFGTWLERTTGDVHYGRVLGAGNRVLWVFLGLLPGILFVTGVSMWWLRVPSKWMRRAATE